MACRLTFAAPFGTGWRGVFGYRSSGGMRVQLMLNVATAVGIPAEPGYDDGDLMRDIFAACDREPGLYLDLLDAVLDQARFLGAEREGLRDVLRIGFSVWTVSETGDSLVRRVDRGAEASFRGALLVGGVAEEELLEAWESAYGRDPNPSDCWDHAIKAVEAALVPIVVPSQAQPQLGHVVGQLESQPQLWELRLGGDVRPLVSMLRLLWPNPDRHGSQDQRRIPTPQEAEGVLHLAIAIVQWTRTEILVRRGRPRV